MPEYNYKARAASGKLVRGNLQASSKTEAKTALLNRGLRPIALRAVGVKGQAAKDAQKAAGGFIVRDANGQIQINLSSNKPSTKELAVFTKQFSLMIENGVPLLQSLGLLSQQQKKPGFTATILKIIHAVETGSNLSEALEPYPGTFDSLYVAMIRAGEASGRLDLILRQLVIYIEKAAKIKAQVKSAMMYPIIVVVVAFSVVGLLMTFVVPSFAKQFKDSGQELPAVTQVVVGFSDWFVDSIHLLIGGGIAFAILFRMWVKTDSGRLIFDTAILKAPLIGSVLSKISIGRFCSTMSTMLSAGVSILEALSICAASSGNKRVENFVMKVREEISKGRSFAEPLMEDALFPKMVTSMVAVGESTGTLDESLAKVTEIYDEEVDTAIDTMTSMIEPIMIVVIGGIIGFIVIAMYLPIFDMASTMGG